MKKSLILVADDDSDDRFLLQAAFQEHGEQETLEFVENGVEVMEFLEAASAGSSHNFPELIMLDLNMPKMNGKEVLSEIKNHPFLKRIPVIIYTTTRNEIEIRKCYELGANTYIVKPISFEGLRDVVSNIRSYWLDTASIPVLE